jgi:maltose-binding protein MalE
MRIAEQVWLGEKTAEQALNEIADKVQAEVKGRYRHTR